MALPQHKTASFSSSWEKWSQITTVSRTFVLFPNAMRRFYCCISLFQWNLFVQIHSTVAHIWSRLITSWDLHCNFCFLFFIHFFTALSTVENDITPHSFGEWLQFYHDLLILQWNVVWNRAEACFLLVLSCVPSLMPASTSLYRSKCHFCKMYF